MSDIRGALEAIEDYLIDAPSDDVDATHIRGLVRKARAALAGDGWRDISTAPKDGTEILARFRSMERMDMQHVAGLPVVIRHPGLARDGFDTGWNLAGPFGHGGFPDNWFEGWQPIPPAPEWRGMKSAPRDGSGFLAYVNDAIRIVGWNKTSHVPMWGWVLYDQGPEDCGLCEPTHWMPLPQPPAGDK